MSRVLRWAVMVLWVVASLAPAVAADEPGRPVRLVGWVVDSYCGKGNANADGKDCTIKCHKDGADLVFWSETDSKIYKLSDQKAALAQVGSKVALIGAASGPDTIKVEKFVTPDAETSIKKG